MLLKIKVFMGLLMLSECKRITKIGFQKLFWDRASGDILGLYF